MSFVKLLALVVPSIALLVGCDPGIFGTKGDPARLVAIDSHFTTADYETALKEVRQYTKDHPEDDQGWCLQGWAHAKLDQLAEAEQCFDKAIALNPKSDNSHVGMGVVCRKQDDLAGARAAYAEAIRLVPDNAEAYSSLLVIELLEGNHRQAADYGEKAWAIRQDLPSIAANLAVVYHYLGEKEKKQFYFAESKRLGYHSPEALEEIFDGTRTIE